MSELFRCKPDRLAYEFMAEYPKMVEWWIKRTVEFGGGSYAVFRKHFYKEWKKEWDGYYSQHAQTSSLVAFSGVQLWKKPDERLKIPELKWRFIVVSPREVKIEKGELLFSTKIGEIAHVKIIPEDQRLRRLLVQAENGYWQVGQSIVTPEWAVVSFTSYLDLSTERETLIKELLSAEATPYR